MTLPHRGWSKSKAQLEGRLWRDGPAQQRTSVLADENYIRESMMNPQAKVVKGFDPIMPTFQGLLKKNQQDGLVAYIESLK
jgi:cytochrome c oxidase subunit 2